MITNNCLNLPLVVGKTKAFEAIEMLKAVIEEKTHTNISALEKKSIEKIQQDHEAILLQIENDALKWIL